MKNSGTFILLRNISVMVCDFLSLRAALWIGYWLWIAYPWHGNYQPAEVYAQILWILPPLGLLVFHMAGLYKEESGILGVEEQSLIFKAIWILYLLGLAISFFYREVKFSRLATFYSIFIALALVSLERYFLRKFFAWLNQKGIGVRNALIYGAGYHGQRLERWIRQSPKLGIRIIGFLDDHVEKLTKMPENLRCLGGIEDLSRFVKIKDVETLFVAHRKLSEEDVVYIFQRCRELGVRCWSIPSLYQFHIERAELFNIGGIPLVGFRHGVERSSYAVVKRFLDFWAALFLIIFISPLMLALMLVMRFSSRGPIFFRQVRIGKDGKKFVMLKFRTLKTNPKGDDVSPELKKGGQDYLPFGRFLRRTGLDELPQLINMIQGDMSLIGPRPEMPFIVEKYGPLERERLCVKPGITGLWQISEDRKRLLIHENMDYDLYYIERFSFNLDLAILVKTFFTVIQRFLATLRLMF